ncbi:MAG TPA: head GIN domain-containing protein [Bacteroidales bacterium]|nr:head GIN domain-containing protein [Bacteroidales bacterium]
MKNLKLITAIFTIISFCTSCIKVDGQIWQTVRGNHHVVTEKRDVNNFTGVKVSSGIDVYLKQGDNVSVTVEADENLQEYIITEVKNGVLNVYSEANIRDAERKRAYVTVEDVNSIRTTSAGDIVGESLIRSDKLELSASSAGNIDLEVKASEIEVEISSSGDITLNGEADIMEADLNSAGSLNAFELKVKDAEISVSSAGDADINVSEKLTARASSAGDINYMGNPEFVDAHSSSAGSIRKR